MRAAETATVAKTAGAMVAAATEAAARAAAARVAAAGRGVGAAEPVVRPLAQMAAAVRARAAAERARAANMDQKPGHCKSLGYLKQAH